MSVRGRKPDPIHLREMKGNPQRRPIPEVPRPDARFPKCPDFLSDEAKAEWAYLRKDLVNLRYVSRLDRMVLASFCESAARYKLACRALAKTSPLIYKPGLSEEERRTSWPMWNPWLSVQESARKQMMSAAGELGLSPSSRSRVRLDPDALVDPDEWEEDKRFGLV